MFLLLFVLDKFFLQVYISIYYVLILLHGYRFSFKTRKYCPVKEARRNEKRKAIRREKKIREELTSKYKLLLKSERSKTRRIRAADKTLSAIADKISRIPSSHARKDLLDKIVSPTKVKKSRIASTLSSTVKVDRRTVTHKKLGRREQKKRIAKKTWRVLQFLQDPQWSVTYPGKKDMISRCT